MRKNRKIAEACYNQMFVAQAPLVIVFFADAERIAERYDEIGSFLYYI